MVEGVTSPEAAAPKKPALLKGGMILAWIYAVVLVLTLAMLPVLDEFKKADTQGKTALPGDAVLHTDIILVGYTTSASQLFIVPLLALSVLVAFGLAKDRYWSRAMMMTLLILAVVLIPPEMASPGMYAASAAVAIFGWWYLYRKPNVVEYYDSLRRQIAKSN